MLVTAILVRVTSSGSVLFRHERVGLNHQPFCVIKFRSMRPDIELTPEQEERFKVEYKLADDPRISGVGRWIRRLSIDEIPQLLNVLGGSMTLVGPRPVTHAELIGKYGADADELVSVKPGLTGLWQTSGRTSLTYEERIALDLRYVRERSLRMDLAILVRTPVVVLLMRGAE